MVVRQFIQLAIARVPVHSCEHAIHIVVACSSTFLPSTSFSRATRVPWRVLFSQHRVTSSAVRVLAASGPKSQRIYPGILLDQPTTPTGSYHQYIPEFSGARRRLTDWASPTSRVRCKIHSDDAFSVAVCLASTVRPLLSPTAWRDHRVCDNAIRTLFHHGLCRVLKLGFALKCMHKVTLIDSYACHTDARR